MDDTMKGKFNQKGKFDRLLKILNLLDQGVRCTPERLCKVLEVTPRSLYRYVQSLQAAGFPVVYDRRRGGYYFDKGFALKRAELTAEEALALAWTRKLFRSQGSSFAQAFDRAQKKIMESSKEERATRWAAVMLTAEEENVPVVDVGDRLRDLAKACTDHYQVLLSYESLSRKELTEKVVEPYFLYFSADGFWNLRAFCRLRQEWRTFALDRIRALQVLDKPFFSRLRTAEDREQHLKLVFGAYFDGAPVEVVVRFAPEMRPQLERKKWHASQRLQVLADGWLEVRLASPGLPPVKPWLYRWLPYVQVMGPPELRQEMLADLRQQMKLLEE